MISRRLLAFALVVAALSGCHEDPSVVTVVVTPTVQPFAIDANGGAAPNGQGGDGGGFTVLVNGAISLGSPGTPPSAPAAPVAPLTGITLPALLATQTIPGNIIVGSLTTPNANTTLTSSNGDIVVSGTMQSFNAGAAGVNITLNAPNGTVYVTGSVRSSVTDATLNGHAAGSVTISALRIVITGTIDARGEANGDLAAGNGGSGGAVTLTATQQIYFTAGAIQTSGGDRSDATGLAGIAGGNAGNVTLSSGSALHVFGSITMNGGAANGNGSSPAGGGGGVLTFSATGTADISSTISLAGGAATGTTLGGVGGDGGAFFLDGAAVTRLYGTLSARGGAATASAGTITGGDAGTLQVGSLARPDSLEMGQGLYGFAGGAGGVDGVTNAGGAGGAVSIETRDGAISIGSSISTGGGAGNYTGTVAGLATGGDAGDLLIIADRTGTNAIVHSLSVPSLLSDLDASGGAATGALNGGNGGDGGALTLQSGGTLTSGARIATSGGAATLGNGGVAGAVQIRVDSAGGPTASGGLSLSGTVTAKGGVSTGLDGGSGPLAGVEVSILQGSGVLSSSATVDVSGGSGGGTIGVGGAPGPLLVSGNGGDLSLSGSLAVNGGSGPGAAAAGGTVSILAGVNGGTVSSTASISANGGSAVATTPANNLAGGAGGSIVLRAQHPSGSMILLPGTTVVANGGNGVGTGNGGAGGSQVFSTRNQQVSLYGTYAATGGAATGTGTGGAGGTFSAQSNLAGGQAGAITLQAGASINVSGGSGAIGGSASGSAVVLDADNGNTNDPLSNGIVSNLGTVTAAGATLNGNGGNVVFDGLNSTTLLAGPAAGSQNRAGSGTGTTGTFTPQ